MDPRLIGRAIEVNFRNLALGHEVFQSDDATFVRNRSLPDIYDANFVFGIAASESAEIDRLLTRVAREYAHAAQFTFRIDPSTPPPFEARLALEGYGRADALVLMLDGPLRGDAVSCDIRPVESEQSWRAYTELKGIAWREHAARVGENLEDVTIPYGLATANRLKCPPVQYVMAYENGRAVGHCSAWEGLDGVGQVEDVFVLPEYRHRGIATALIRSSVETARRRGAGAVVIVSDPTDTPRLMYAALGWQPVAVCRQYGKRRRA